LSRYLPPEPVFGAPLPIPPKSQAALNVLALRRSASAPTLQAPGPDAETLNDMLRLAARVPDHGKLAPWRFIVLEGADKAAFAAALEALADDRPDPERLKAALFKLKVPPLSVVVVSRVVEGKIPAWEQELSAGAVCMSLLIAAQAMGFGANWITDWYAFDEGAKALLGLQPGERVAGYVHLGTPGEPPAERVRPDLAAITTRWTSSPAQPRPR
jgi:nitroreductase